MAAPPTDGEIMTTKSIQGLACDAVRVALAKGPVMYANLLGPIKQATGTSSCPLLNDGWAALGGVRTKVDRGELISLPAKQTPVAATPPPNRLKTPPSTSAPMPRAPRYTAAQLLDRRLAICGDGLDIGR